MALAGVVAMRPRSLVLDEPTAGLDPAGVAALLATLGRLHADGTQLVVATHDVDMTLGWADRVAVMNRGRVVAVGRPDEVFRDRALLAATGLRAPWVVEVGDALRDSGIWPAGRPGPRTPDEVLAGIVRPPER